MERTRETGIDKSGVISATAAGWLVEDLVNSHPHYCCEIQYKWWDIEYCAPVRYMYRVESKTGGRPSIKPRFVVIRVKSRCVAHFQPPPYDGPHQVYFITDDDQITCIARRVSRGRVLTRGSPAGRGVCARPSQGVKKG